MGFEDYEKRINLIKQIETFGQLPKEKQKQNRFAIKNNQIVLEETEKSKFTQINDKRYYFSDVRFPFLIHFCSKSSRLREKKKLNIFTNRKT